MPREAPAAPGHAKRPSLRSTAPGSEPGSPPSRTPPKAYPHPASTDGDAPSPAERHPAPPASDTSAADATQDPAVCGTDRPPEGSPGSHKDGASRSGGYEDFAAG